MHYLHVGYVGLAGSARYMEMADFLLGWIGIDIAGDDGTKLGQSPEELDTIFVWDRAEPPPIYTHCERCGGRFYAPGMACGPGGWSPIRAVRRIFVRRQPKSVCHCPMAEQRAVASRPARRRWTLLPITTRSPSPSVASQPSVSMLPEDCPVRQAVEGKSTAAQLVSGGTTVVSTGVEVGKLAWRAGRLVVRVALIVPSVIRALAPSRRERERTPPRTAKARPQLPRP